MGTQSDSCGCTTKRPARRAAWNFWIRIAATSGALILYACAPHVHTLKPEMAGAGYLEHDSDGDGRLQLSYAGKSYAGEFKVKRSRRIHGEHQRHPGSVVHSVLVAPDGDRLTCDVQWPNAGNPTGTCNNKAGESFDVRFD